MFGVTRAGWTTRAGSTGFFHFVVFVTLLITNFIYKYLKPYAIDFCHHIEKQMIGKMVYMYREYRKPRETVE